ncbi:hypothetical protein Trydic_g9883 [Trypoxylus dichotomus]
MIDKEQNGEDSEERKKITDRDLPLAFAQNRHSEAIEGINCITQTWRTKERMKTVSVALVLCLNVGVDPPDVIKTQPCARLECWIDPLSMSPQKALDAIGVNLQKQYERWQPRARYKQSLDPTAEDVKKLCTSLRKNAKEERVLFHYNGHGVPKPTVNGEIWVFNRSYTQYIPLSIYDLQKWMGAPSIYVYDCSNAGIIVESFKQFATQHETEKRNTPPSSPLFTNCIQLAACSADQVLPMNPDLPADLFTSCLTTPIRVALRWYVLQSTSKLVPKVNINLIDRIPGQITDRKTMLGELNWIFTAITDTIAWNTLPRDLFQKLFRQDLLVASLFRNFLLAERIMRSCDCTPISDPPLPPTFQHPMWQAWDLAVDLSLGQLYQIRECGEPFVHLPFFEEQLTAFEVWLKLGSEERSPPEQLPIVLQVLLSQVHRMRALELLGRFLDLGPWAVTLALSVGIFPYVLKLLQSSTKELRPLLVFIWAKILAVDNSCQGDLVRDNGHKYFLSVLQDPTISSQYRTQAAFVLACIVNEYPDGQEAALQGSLVSICLEQLSDPSPQLRQWVAICLGRLWDHYEKARWTGVRDNAHDKLYTLLQDPCAEVRAAAVYALGTFINSVPRRSEHANTIDHSIAMTLVNTLNGDMSNLVRKELVAAMQWVVLAFEHAFLNVAIQENLIQASQEYASPSGIKRIGSRDKIVRLMSPASSHANIDVVDSSERIKRVSSSSSINLLNHHGSFSSLPGSVYTKLWAGLCLLDTDPHPEVAKMSTMVTGYIRSQVTKSQLRDSGDGKYGSSVSLPPSPNNRPSYLAESPPTLHPQADLQKQRSNTLGYPGRKFHPNPISEEKEVRDYSKKVLVSTNFVVWSCKQFAQSVTKEFAFKDVESKTHYEKEWRFIRNESIRKEAAEDQRRAASSKLESQTFNTRCAAPPSIVQFHPYDQQIAVAGRDSFAIWDWGTGAKLSYCHCKSAKNATSQITALEWVNAFDVGLLMAGSNDGSVKIWRPNSTGSREPVLVSAWQAHNELVPPSKGRTSNDPVGLLLAWEQWTQAVISTGDTRVLRFWDAEKEMKAYDIPTGADCSVTCLDSTYSQSSDKEPVYPLKYDPYDDLDCLVMGCVATECDEVGTKTGLVAAGCSDGSVRIFDRRRNPAEARIKTWMEHNSPVLGVQMRDNTVISGSVSGDVRIYDIRRGSSVSSQQPVQSSRMTAFAIHRAADTYACAANQSVGVYNLNGNCINVIRFYEGFMGYRIGPVNCLAYHPHKVALAIGTADCSISVYCLDHRR